MSTISHGARAVASENEVQAIDERLDFMQMTPESCDAVRTLKGLVERELPAALDRLYAQIRQTPETLRLFSSEDHIDRARAAQSGHWRNISNADFNRDYAGQVRMIGTVHARIGLEPRWYIGGYALVLDHLINAAVADAFGADGSDAPMTPEAFGKALGSLARAFLLDIDLAISVYIEEAEKARRAAHERMSQMALYDSLTGLPNRARFNDWLDHEIDLAEETGGRLAVIGIDLNRFKEINDLRGHGAGDEVLRILGRRLNNLLRDGEFVARLGGDEFAAIHRIRDDTGLPDFLARLETALFRPIRLDDYEVIPGASIGVALYPDDARHKQTLIGNADLAMYRAKADIARAICFYEPSMDETVRARRARANDLRVAIETGQLDLHYQVQTSVPTGEIRGYEALLRWRHPEQGNIPPAEFIPLAEENGLILRIGEWVLRTACAAAAAWEQPYKVAVNLSPVQFAHADLPHLVRTVLSETRLPPERLELELTEATIFTDRDRSLHMLRQIRALGVSIALDDFGTGYSSLETLRSFPFDKIKLDRSFMREVESSPQAKAIIRAVLALGKSLEIPVLAEGIETRGQLSLLGTEGCDEAQGFLLGRPAPLDEIVVSGQITLTAGGGRGGTLAARSA